MGPYNQTYCDIYHFKDGKIIEFTTYLDVALSSDSRNEDLKKLIAELNTAFEKGDLNFLRSHMTDDVEWKIIGNANIIKGKEKFIEICSAAPLKDGTSKVIATNIIIKDDNVAAEIIIEAETLTGKQYKQTGCDIYHFIGDKFDKLTSYLDTAYDAAVLDGEKIHPESKN